MTEAGDVELASAVSNRPSLVLPTGVFDKLYDYQTAGLEFMWKLFEKQEGGILADEMGLGKTVMVTSFLCGLRRAGLASHVLVLLPVTLLETWEREAKLWCPQWRVWTLHGRPDQRQRALRGAMRPSGGILLTSYELLCKTVEELRAVAVRNEAEPPAKRSRRVEKAVANPSGDDEDRAEEMDEEQMDPDLLAPAGARGLELPEVGSRRPWDVIVCDEAHRF